MENPFEILYAKIDALERLIQELDRKITSETAERSGVKWLTVEELAAYLHLSTSVIYKMTMNREVPCVKTGKRLYFNRTEIDIWMQRFRIKTAEEIEDEAITYIQKHKRNRQ